MAPTQQRIEERKKEKDKFPHQHGQNEDKRHERKEYIRRRGRGHITASHNSYDSASSYLEVCRCVDISYQLSTCGTDESKDQT